MLKKTITYEDYDGNKATEDFYFHLNKVELIEMETTTKGGYSERLKKIAENKDPVEIMNVIKELIIKSYGIRSEDGKHFRKNAEITEDFACSEAFSELYMELCTNADSAAEFIKGIIPKVDNLPAAPIPEKTT